MKLKLEPEEDIPISKLEEIWRSYHLYARSTKQDQSIHATFRRFNDAFAGMCQFVHEITRAQASEFIETMRQQFAYSTVKRIKGLLASAFADALPPCARNHFALMKLRRDKNEEVVHRRPLSETELERLLAEAKKDPLLYSLTVTAVCTGLRLGDVCNLRWDSVSLSEGVINVITRKTGAEVTVPILPLFRTVLESALAEKADNEFVFPDAARPYAKKPSTLIRKIKELFARALFPDEANRANMTKKGLLRLTRQERKAGRKSASLYGWHSFRATFVTLTLTYHAPVETVRHIVGHTTADMTLTYFHPTRSIMAETFRRQMAGSVLSGATAALPYEIAGQPTAVPTAIRLNIPVPRTPPKPSIPLTIECDVAAD